MAVLSRLSVRHFRNLSSVDVCFPAGVTLLSGRNGQGKSNVLEAICYLGLLRSFRTQGIVPLRQWGSDAFSLRGLFEDRDPAFRFNLHVTQGDRRVLAINGTPLDRASDFINQFICVPLVPEDISLVKGGAAGRRRFLDIVLSQHEPGYLAELQGYRDAVRNRNALLRRRPVQSAVLKPFEDILVHHGAGLEAQRQRYVGAFNEHLGSLSETLISSHSGCFGAQYIGGGGSVAEGTDREQCQDQLREALERHRQRDEREGHTTVGPHRADLAITLGERSVGNYGSEGECRMAALAMRLASLHLMRQRGTDTRGIVVLVDDVFGELDAERTDRFFSAVTSADQLIVTSTDVPQALSGSLAAHFTVTDGVVTAV